MTLSQIEKQQMLDFQLTEAKWLDEIVRPMLPSWLKNAVESRSGTKIGELLHFLVDRVVINDLLGIRIERSQDTTVLGGNGFRQGVDHGYRIDRVRTTVKKRGREIAKREFPVNIIVRNNP